ncbi:hypothetical protein DE146DRAFT_614874 [Phaeosphaeria sp. MPI-PUGE-AT-0046c]|nr:hypothetical protein DE146DRAFT_614874 [Phaeosphaeria sp. MPI-PUGE-AT-0046c]
MTSTRSSRAPSFTSDRPPSVAGSITFQMPTNIRPPPAYIAASVASQTVTDHHNAQLREDDADADELNAFFSEQALSLLNSFLDHLLFAFLFSARSPSLTAIRPAIADVLKPRLAREATEAADEELEGLLAGEDEEFPSQDTKAADRWDVEKVWKRTRLRIMVYTRLGELEDEDEEKYVQQERGLSMDDDEDDEAGLVSWASAIFLTSVIEYIAEQTLLIAGSAAYARMATKAKKLAQRVEDPIDLHMERLVVEEPDVEKIALNSALGRLWRTWRKRVRSPLSPMSPGRGLHSVSSYSSLHRRKMSHDTIDGSARGDRSPIPEHVPTETEIAANIPLPEGDNDVNEIEVPGLARTFELDHESTGTQTPIPRRQRPSSVIVLAPVETFRRRSAKVRPVSMPPPPTSEFSVPPLFSKRASITTDPDKEPEPEVSDEIASEVAVDGTSDIKVEEQPAIPAHVQTEEQQATESPQEADADMMAFAASTGMGFRMSMVDPIRTDVPDAAEHEPEVPSAGGYESEPKIMQSKRMSVGKPGPPGIVRTFSTRSSSLRSAQVTPVPSPALQQQPEQRSYLDDAQSTDDEDERQAIGVARTSDIPIRSTPTPPVDAFHDKGRHATQGGYVEVQPRQTCPTSMSVRNTPTPEAQPVLPERSVARKDPHKRDFSGGEYAAAGPSHAVNITSAPRRADAPPPKSRGASLPSLQEVDPHPRQRTASEVSGSHNVHQRSPSIPNRVSERQARNKSTESAQRIQRVPLDASPSSEKSGVQRMPSTSSKKSATFPAKHSGRDSRMSEEDRERQFESLVNGEETVKFTLTPQNVRDFDVESNHRPTTSNVTVHPRVNADKDNSFGTGHLPSRSSSRSKGPVAAPAKSSPSRKVVGRQLAREPRIEGESMRDFADFIRSTGPSPGQEKPIQPFVNVSGNGPRPANASTSSLGRRISTKQNGPRGMESPSAKPRINMEPRSPAGLSTGNNDLIDFIRQGPPSAQNGQPRIPRNVAPFRTTVDSDQFDTMLGEHGNVESAYGSTASTLESKQSTQTINSRTGLIPEPKVVQPAYSNMPQNLTGNMASGSEPVVTRTRRRVKDPYAIDFSDEEDDDDEDDDQLTALPPSSHPPPAHKQESMMDFLNGMEPPSNSKPEPFMLSPETIAAAKARASASNSTLSSSHTATRTGPSQYGAISSTSIASDAHRSYKPRLQARAPAVSDTRTSRTATSDLADFLKNSGPPEPPINTTLAKKEDEKKSRKANKPQSPASPDELPHVVFWPRSTRETSLLLSECNTRTIPVTSYGSGTSFGGALHSTGGICISFEKMNQLIKVNEDDMDAVVQAGLGWVELNELIEDSGLFFPVDPAPGASIGGMIAMSCSGTNAYAYGTMKERVISLTCVLADGRVVTTHKRPRKTSAGYDLMHLMVGSEGTLGLVTEAVVRLAPVPRNLHVGIVTLGSFKEGVDVVVALQRSGHKLEALELADGPQMHALNASKLSSHKFMENPTLFLKFAGPSTQFVNEQINVMKHLCRNSLSFEITSQESRIGVIWGARKSMAPALIAMKKDPTDLFIHSDCAVPISNLPALITGTQSLIDAASPSGDPWFCANVGHVGDGNVHSSIICPASDKAKAEAVLRQVTRLALRLEGTITGEHGVGSKLRDALEEEVGRVGVDTMRSIKRSLDPRGILNPGKVIRLEEGESEKARL